jgi:hypothetical protein
MNPRALALLFAAAGLAWLNAAGPTATAETRDASPATAFTSGAMRSELLLRDIAATLRSIDARLERVETLLSEGGSP